MSNRSEWASLVFTSMGSEDKPWSYTIVIMVFKYSAFANLNRKSAF